MGKVPLEHWIFQRDASAKLPKIILFRGFEDDTHETAHLLSVWICLCFWIPQVCKTEVFGVRAAHDQNSESPPQFDQELVTWKPNMVSP